MEVYRLQIFGTKGHQTCWWSQIWHKKKEKRARRELIDTLEHHRKVLLFFLSPFRSLDPVWIVITFGIDWAIVGVNRRRDLFVVLWPVYTNKRLLSLSLFVQKTKKCSQEKILTRTMTSSAYLCCHLFPFRSDVFSDWRRFFLLLLLRRYLLKHTSSY